MLLLSFIALMTPANAEESGDQPEASSESAAAAETLKGIGEAALEIAAESTGAPAMVGLSGDERKCLAEGMYFEARGESVSGQLAVGRVILNRVTSVAYPNSICGVVYQNDDKRNRCQFSFACDGKEDVVTESAKYEEIEGYANWLLAGEAKPTHAFQMASLQASTHYHADYVAPNWANRLTLTGRIGHHYFYFDPSAYPVQSAWLPHDPQG
jgi:spore germination cell wall hydrolase CwlJ-like protein